MGHKHRLHENRPCQARLVPDSQPQTRWTPFWALPVKAD